MPDRRAVCLNCIDGRVQLPVIEWIKANYPVDHVDMVTEPGMDGCLADRAKSIDAIADKVKVSVSVNKASVIFIVGHFDCRGNPVEESAHKANIQASVGRIREAFDGLEVVGLWVNDRWNCEPLGA